MQRLLRHENPENYKRLLNSRHFFELCNCKVRASRMPDVLPMVCRIVDSNRHNANKVRMMTYYERLIS
jgi:hypothetical protein